MESKEVHADSVGQASSEILVEPYSAIAPYYDTIMRDVNYDEWLSYIHQIFKKYGCKPKRILDLACGTGTCCIPLSKEGYDIVGIDSSEAMLRIAEEKTDSEGLVVTYLHQKMESFSLPDQVDVTISLFDSLNYILSEEQMLKTYRRVYETLRTGGLFIFDLNTKYGLARGLGDAQFIREDREIVSIWRNSFDSESGIAKLELTLFVPEEDHYIRIDETHLERAYSLSTVSTLLNKVGFVEVRVFKHLTFRSPDPATKRVMVLAKKAP
jgi:ubiquinone/menaquinone biosynthesis C-methylase UbiE